MGNRISRARLSRPGREARPQTEGELGSRPMRRLILLPLMAVCVALLATPAAEGQQQAAGWRTCGPPPNTFYYSLKVYGTTCGVGQRVLTHGHCLNLPRCSRHRFGPWLCRTGSSILDRATVCRHGSRRIVARASGD